MSSDFLKNRSSFQTEPRFIFEVAVKGIIKFAEVVKESGLSFINNLKGIYKYMHKSISAQISEL